MEQKTKIIIIGLAAILVASFFITLSTYTAKQSVEKERDQLKKENASLAKRVDEAMGENKRLSDKVGLFNSDYTKVTQEKEELEKKFQIINKERQDLADQLTNLKSQRQPGSQSSVSSAPSSDDAYWAGLVKAKTDLEFQVDNLRAELKNTQTKADSLQREKASLELEVNNLNRETTDLKRQLGYNQKLMDSIAQDLVREKNDKYAIEGSIKSIKNDNALLRRQLKGLNNRKDDLENRLDGLAQQNQSLARRLNEMEVILQDKTGQIDNLKSKAEAAVSGVTVEAGQAARKDMPVELPPITVRPQPKSVVLPEQKELDKAFGALAGRVIAINRENNFVVIDLGEDAGVKVGDTFQAYNKEGLSAAALEVIQTRKNISACDIKREKESIVVGYTVR